MKISEQWLREWVAPKLSTRALAERLTLAGLEVGALGPVAPPLVRVVVGKIVALAPHPAAERLRVCEVNVGERETRTIVCGAANAAVGLKAPVALPGARLPGGRAVAAAEIRGVKSRGMLCSAAELGLEESSSGLLALDKNARPGVSLTKYLALDDIALDVELTPNRGDCLSVMGLAREVVALTGARLKGPRLRRTQAKSRRRLGIVLEEPRDCPRYAGRVIEGINPDAATPLWMRERLRRSGQRSIHPVVDVTNYVLLELGQPMHAFDLDRITGAIHARRAGARETLTLLDGTAIALEAGSLLIADDVKPLALAGIMGGLDSAVGAATRGLFLECAHFRPEAVARRARALGLQTESSQRFERGVDPRLPRLALERATELLLQIVGGRPGPVIERVSKRYLPAPRPVRLRAARIGRILGAALPTTRVERILSGLGMKVKRAKAGWLVTPPSWRFDIGREIDLIEEAARVNGYENLPRTRPDIGMNARPLPEGRVSEARQRAVLADRDYQEIVTYSFVDPGLQALIDPGVESYRLANPISADMAAMRTGLWPGLLKTMLYNQNRQIVRQRLFEIGRCFVPAEEEGEISQERKIAGAVTGPALAEQWGSDGRAADFYDTKGDVEALLALTGRAQEFRFRPAGHPALHPGKSAEILCAGARVGWIGVSHPEIQTRLGLEQPAVLFELLLAASQQARIPAYREISKFPAIRRDLAVVVDEAVSAERVLENIGEVAGKLLVNLELFDEYRGKGIDSGRKSLAMALTLQDSSRTLTDTEVEAILTDVVTTLESQLGAQLRR